MGLIVIVRALKVVTNVENPRTVTNAAEARAMAVEEL